MAGELIPFPIQRKSAGEAVEVILAVLDELAVMAIAEETHAEVAAEERGLIMIMGRAELVQHLIHARQRPKIREVQ